MRQRHLVAAPETGGAITPEKIAADNFVRAWKREGHLVKELASVRREMVANKALAMDFLKMRMLTGDALARELGAER